MERKKTFKGRLERAFSVDSFAAAFHAVLDGLRGGRTQDVLSSTRDKTHKMLILRSSRGGLITLLAIMLSILVAGSCVEVANAGDTGQDSKPVNTGQDPTDPITRFDIRWENDELPYDNNFNNNNDADTVILRVDAPIPLGKKGDMGTLAFRMDLPFQSTRTTVPGDDGTFGFGSVYLQFLHIVPKSWGNLPKADKWAWGYAAQAATATNGRQNRTDIAMFGSKWNFNLGKKKRGGTFATSVLKYYNSDSDLANGFDAISELHVQPIINFGIPKAIDFVTLWGNFDWVFNFEDGVVGKQESGDYFIPYDITVGKMLSGGKVVLSATIAGDLFSSSNFKQFDERFMVRVGFFF